MDTQAYYPSSFLSPNAKHLLQLLSKQPEEFEVTCDCVEPNGFLVSDVLATHLGDSVVNGDFSSAITALSHTLPLCVQKLRSMNVERFVQGQPSTFSWLYTPCEFAALLRQANESTLSKFSLLLRIIALLEFSLSRLLADDQGMHAPNNMNAILENPRTKQLIGRPFLHVLMTLVGPVNSLNLRNLFWHGYASLVDCEENVIEGMFYLMVSLTSSIGAKMRVEETLVKSPLTNSSLSNSRQLMKLVISPNNNVHISGQLALHGALGPYNIPVFLSLFKLFDGLRKRYAKDASCVGVVCLSMLLRTAFCRAIGWVEGVCSSDARFFLTLDSMLQMNLCKIYKTAVSFEQWEQFAHLVGYNVILQLSSLFCAQQGPRIRPRLTHGELFETWLHMTVDVQGLWNPLANYLHDILSHIIFRTATDEIPKSILLDKDSFFARAETFHVMSILLNKIWQFWSSWTRLLYIRPGLHQSQPAISNQNQQNLSDWFSYALSSDEITPLNIAVSFFALFLLSYTVSSNAVI